MSSTIEFEYIRAIRTASSSRTCMNSFIEKELASVNQPPEYQQRLRRLKNFNNLLLDTPQEHSWHSSRFPARNQNLKFEMTSGVDLRP